MIPNKLNKLASEDNHRFLNVFHEWKSIDHSFEEIRILLKNYIEKTEAQSDFKNQIHYILKDGKVDGKEINTASNVLLGDQYVGLYMTEEDVLPIDIPVKVKQSTFADEVPFILPFLFDKHRTPEGIGVLNDHCINLFIKSGNTLDKARDFLHYDSLESYLRRIAISKDQEQSEDYKDFDIKRIGLSEASLNDKRSKIVKQFAEKLRPIVEDATGPFVILCSSHFAGIAARHFADLIKKELVIIKSYDLKESDLKSPKKLQEFLKPEPDQKHTDDYKYKISTSDPAVVMALCNEHMIQHVHINEEFLRFHLARMEQLDELKHFNKYVLQLQNRGVDIIAAESSDDIFQIHSNQLIAMSEDRYFPPMEDVARATELLWRSFCSQ